LGSRGLQELLSWPVLELRVTDVASNGTIRHEAVGYPLDVIEMPPTEAALHQHKQADDQSGNADDNHRQEKVFQAHSGKGLVPIGGFKTDR
jgi:hypothetical protein